MKKLMIAAAAAAMIGGAYAALPDASATIDDDNVGIMHNVAITVKTLMPTATKSSKGCVICPDNAECYIFEQGTLKLNGIFASCGCEDMFKYGYFWLGSGKKATKLYDKLAASVKEYDDLPEADAELGVTLTVNRYGKTMKKSVATLKVDADGVKFDGVGFGSYTDAKYKYDKDADEYILKSTAKVNVSGSVVGTVDTSKLALYLYDQGKLSAADALETYKYFAVDGGCTIDLDCETDGTAATEVPLMGTFAVKAASVKALNKVIPAVCWAE